MANGEDNRDGANDNNSWNCGAEGPTDDAGIKALREQQKRNLLATLLLSQGVPMMLAGDETGHTQQGNNNAYCQDNELTWLNWELSREQRELLEFARKVVELRLEQPVLQRRKFLQGRSIRGSEIKDIVWLENSGKEITDEAWSAGFVRCFGVILAGDVIDEHDEHGERISGDTLMILFNSHHEPLPFRLPVLGGQRKWERILDTADPRLEQRISKLRINLAPRSLVIFRAHHPDD